MTNDDETIDCLDGSPSAVSEIEALKRVIRVFMIGLLSITPILVLLYLSLRVFWPLVALVPIAALVAWYFRDRNPVRAAWAAAVSISPLVALGFCYVTMGGLLWFSGQDSPAFALGSVDTRGSAISLRGNILPGTLEQWRMALAAVEGTPTLIRLHSPGGDLDVARKIAAQVHELGITVQVASGRYCKSSCISIFSSGAKRVVDPSAIFMFHATAAPVLLPYMQPLRVRKFWIGADTLEDDLAAYPLLRTYLVENGAFSKLEPTELSAGEIAKIDPSFATLANTP